MIIWTALVMLPYVYLSRTLSSDREAIAKNNVLLTPVLQVIHELFVYAKQQDVIILFLINKQQPTIKNNGLQS